MLARSMGVSAHCRARRLSAVLFLLLYAIVQSAAQVLTKPAPDGTPSATFDQDCVTSKFFDFTYRLPSGMSLDDMSNAPNGGDDPTHKNFVIFMAHRNRGINRDVVNAAAEDRRSTSDPRAASWIRALHNMNESRTDVPFQGKIEPISLGNQQFYRLRFQQSRGDGVLTYEAAYGTGVRGYVLYFILGSVIQAELATLEKSLDSFSSKADSCQAGDGK